MIDFGQKLKFLAYFEIRDGKIWENDPRTKKTQKSKFLLTKSTLRLVSLKSVCIQVEKNAVERILKNIASSSRKLDFSIFSLCDSRKTTKSADFGLFFRFCLFPGFV